MVRLVMMCAAAIHAVAATTLAHFPFILVSPAGTSARLVMSEVLAPDPDVKIDIVMGAKLWVRSGDAAPVPLTLNPAAEHMDLSIPGEGTRVIGGIADLGVMKRGKPHLLIYYPKAIIGDAFDAATRVGKSAPVELIPVRGDAGMHLRLVINGEPASGKEVRVLTPDGDEEPCTTDAGGLTPAFADGGRFGAWARHWVDESGERSGEKYEQVRHYATIVFDWSGLEKEPAASGPRLLPTPMPQAVASFGAVESEGWLYLYGGHTARRHKYSRESVSGRFYRLNLREQAAWEELPGSTPVQGMNLAASNGRIYRAGGMEPRNAAGEDADNYSVSRAEAFDSTLGRWTELPELPRPRSSHDLVVTDGKLCAVGGWLMTGKGNDPTFLDTIDILDLNAPSAQWTSIAQPFGRRALIAVAAGGRLWVIGGFDATETARLDVDVYDFAAGSWSKGPPIPGEESNGFGPAACVHGGRVYLSVATGELFRLSSDCRQWEPITRATPRIVHRMVSYADEILIVGGASNTRMTDLIEAVRVSISAE